MSNVDGGQKTQNQNESTNDVQKKFGEKEKQTLFGKFFSSVDRSSPRDDSRQMQTQVGSKEGEKLSFAARAAKKVMGGLDPKEIYQEAREVLQGINQTTSVTQEAVELGIEKVLHQLDVQAPVSHQEKNTEIHDAVLNWLLSDVTKAILSLAVDERYMIVPDDEIGLVALNVVVSTLRVALGEIPNVLPNIPDMLPGEFRFPSQLLTFVFRDVGRQFKVFCTCPESSSEHQHWCIGKIESTFGTAFGVEVYFCPKCLLRLSLKHLQEEALSHPDFRHLWTIRSLLEYNFRLYFRGASEGLSEDIYPTVSLARRDMNVNRYFVGREKLFEMGGKSDVENIESYNLWVKDVKDLRVQRAKQNADTMMALSDALSQPLSPVPKAKQVDYGIGRTIFEKMKSKKVDLGYDDDYDEEQDQPESAFGQWYNEGDYDDQEFDSYHGGDLNDDDEDDDQECDDDGEDDDQDVSPSSTTVLKSLSSVVADVDKKSRKKGIDPLDPIHVVSLLPREISSIVERLTNQLQTATMARKDFILGKIHESFVKMLRPQDVALFDRQFDAYSGVFDTKQLISIKSVFSVFVSSAKSSEELVVMVNKACAGQSLDEFDSRGALCTAAINIARIQILEKVRSRVILDSILRTFQSSFAAKTWRTFTFIGARYPAFAAKLAHLVLKPEKTVVSEVPKELKDEKVVDIDKTFGGAYDGQISEAEFIRLKLRNSFGSDCDRGFIPPTLTDLEIVGSVASLISIVCGALLMCDSIYMRIVEGKRITVGTIFKVLTTLLTPIRAMSTASPYMKLIGLSTVDLMNTIQVLLKNHHADTLEADDSTSITESDISLDHREVEKLSTLVKDFGFELSPSISDILDFVEEGVCMLDNDNATLNTLFDDASGDCKKENKPVVLSARVNAYSQLVEWSSKYPVRKEVRERIERAGKRITTIAKNQHNPICYNVARYAWGKARRQNVFEPMKIFREHGIKGIMVIFETYPALTISAVGAGVIIVAGVAAAVAGAIVHQGRRGKLESGQQKDLPKDFPKRPKILGMHFDPKGDFFISDPSANIYGLDGEMLLEPTGLVIKTQDGIFLKRGHDYRVISTKNGKVYDREIRLGLLESLTEDVTKNRLLKKNQLEELLIPMSSLGNLEDAHYYRTRFYEKCKEEIGKIPLEKIPSYERPIDYGLCQNCHLRVVVPITNRSCRCQAADLGHITPSTTVKSRQESNDSEKLSSDPNYERPPRKVTVLKILASEVLEVDNSFFVQLPEGVRVNGEGLVIPEYLESDPTVLCALTLIPLCSGLAVMGTLLYGVYTSHKAYKIVAKYLGEGAAEVVEAEHVEFVKELPEWMVEARPNVQKPRSKPLPPIPERDDLEFVKKEDKLEMFTGEPQHVLHTTAIIQIRNPQGKRIANALYTDKGLLMNQHVWKLVKEMSTVQLYCNGQAVNFVIEDFDVVMHPSSEAIMVRVNVPNTLKSDRVTLKSFGDKTLPKGTSVVLVGPPIDPTKVGQLQVNVGVLSTDGGDYRINGYGQTVDYTCSTVDGDCGRVVYFTNKIIGLHYLGSSGKNSFFPTTTADFRTWYAALKNLRVFPFGGDPG